MCNNEHSIHLVYTIMDSGNLQNTENARRAGPKYCEHNSNTFRYYGHVIFSTFLCNSTQAEQQENPLYYLQTYPLDVDMQDAIPLYSVLGRSKRYSVEQTEYAAINKPIEQRVSSTRPLHQTENLNASPNQVSQEGLHYAKPDLSKKRKHLVSPLSTCNESPPPIPPHIEDD